MPGHHIDVVLPGPEGGWIARALEDAGFATARPETLVGCAGSLLVVDRTTEGFVACVADFDGPVIAVGWDAIEEEELERLGLDAFYARPVPIAKVVRHAESLLGLEPRLSSIPPRRSRPPDAPPREPTVQLDADELPPRDSTVHLEDDASAVHRLETGSGVDGDTGGDALEVHALGSDAIALSPRLDALLRAADRRLFPGEAPLDIRFPAGEESAAALVPDELLAEVSMPLDPQEGADPLEAFTFVGSIDLLDTGAGRLSAPVSSVSSNTPHTIIERGERSVPPPASSSGSQSSVDLTREGLLPAGGALRLLWQLRDSSTPSRVSLDVAGSAGLELTIDGDVLVDFAGPAHLRVADALRREGRLAASAENEAAAIELLQEAIHRGLLDEFERDADVRRAREALIGEACMASETRFAVTSAKASVHHGAPWIARTVLEVAVAHLRRALPVRDALRWLDAKKSDRLVLASNFPARCRDAGLEPELFAAFERAAGGSIGQLLSGMAATEGAAGALFALASADALRFEPGEAESPHDAAALRALVTRANAVAREGTYFDVLGVKTTATAREIVEAYERLSRRLASIDLLGLAELDGSRQESLEAIQDAFDVLRDERLRDAYSRGIRR